MGEDVRNIISIYRIYNNYYTDFDYFNFYSISGDIKVILNDNVDNQSNKIINSEISLEKYKESFDKIHKFNSLFIKSLINNQVVEKNNNEYIFNSDFNKRNIYLENNYFIKVLEDFDELLKNEEL